MTLAPVILAAIVSFALGWLCGRSYDRTDRCGARDAAYAEGWRCGHAKATTRVTRALDNFVREKEANEPARREAELN